MKKANENTKNNYETGVVKKSFMFGRFFVRQKCAKRFKIKNKLYLDFYKKTKSRYSVFQVQSHFSLFHKETLPLQAQDSIGLKFSIVKNMPLEIRFGKRFTSAPQKSTLLDQKQYQLLSFLVSEESLHSLIHALWRVYHSNNLRLSHSFFRLINLITERGFKLKELLPPYGFTNNVTRVRNFLNRYETRIRSFLPINNMFINKSNLSMSSLTANTSSFDEISHQLRQDNFFNVMQNPRLFNSVAQTDNLFFSGGGIVPVLERIYEGIESNYLFYNSSSYQSVKTLYRLTNSLWKIYSGHNLELSRNFTSLINTVTEKNKINKFYNQENSFSTTASLHNLLNALKRSFSGGNLHLRHSLINLFHDIRTAGDKTKTTNTNKKIFTNHSEKTQERMIFRQKERIKSSDVKSRLDERHTETNNRFSEKYKDTILLYRIFHYEKAANSAVLTHVPASVSEQNTTSIKQLQQYIDQKLKAANLSKDTTLDAESVIKTVMRRIKDEQAEQWRYEKLQRGLF